jgi:vacuolar-type H+-ATPase subunit H
MTTASSDTSIPQPPEFSRVWRGYDPEQVGSYIRALWEQLASAHETIRESRTTLEPFDPVVPPATPDPVSEWASSNAVKVLQAAQDTADQVANAAAEEARRILEAARRDAADIVATADADSALVAERYRDAVSLLQSQSAEFQRAVMALRSEQLPALRNLVETLEGIPIDVPAVSSLDQLASPPPPPTATPPHLSSGSVSAPADATHPADFDAILDGFHTEGFHPAKISQLPPPPTWALPQPQRFSA